jgi:hypothetical protein
VARARPPNRSGHRLLKREREMWVIPSPVGRLRPVQRQHPTKTSRTSALPTSGRNRAANRPPKERLPTRSQLPPRCCWRRHQPDPRRCGVVSVKFRGRQLPQVDTGSLGVLAYLDRLRARTDRCDASLSCPASVNRFSSLLDPSHSLLLF